MSKKTLRNIISVVIVIAAVVVKFYTGGGDDSSKPRGKEMQSTAAEDLKKPSDKKQGGYAVLENCTYIADKYNDGDSFKVKTADGRVVEIRMYFVDTAESRDKPYADHRERVEKQGDYFGNLDYKTALKLGKKAKEFAMKSLKGKKFTVYTKWEEVYTSGRYYAFVKLNGTWWHETLVKKGLARIHTKGSDLPNGTRWKERKKQLRNLEEKAKRADAGGWGM